MADTLLKEKPHYAGHRQRLRQRILEGGADSLLDYELLEVLLFAGHPRADVKPLAKKLIAHFGSFAKVLTAPPERLSEIEGMGDAAIAMLKATQESTTRLLKEQVTEKPVLQSWNALLDYCHATMGHTKHEEFRILFLNAKNILIGDEVQQRGTVDHTPVYPREVVKRALDIGASALIIVHNHPSGDATPSKADIDMTNQIKQAALHLGVVLHDHLIITAGGHYSFRTHGLL